VSVTVEHAGLGAAYLRSHPDVPIAHEDDEACAYCQRDFGIDRLKERPAPYKWGIPCEKAEEFCGKCGRQLILTDEPGRFDRESGERVWERWHSCPRYFMSVWRNILTLGTGGMGHDSHSADNVLTARQWR
jgi:hypothetical protein